MKKLLAIITVILLSGTMFAQSDTLIKPNEPDTTYITFGKMKILIVDQDDDGVGDGKEGDTMEISVGLDGDTIKKPEVSTKSELTHWGGVDLGMTFLLDENQDNAFGGDEEWLRQDYARSFSWNFNFWEYKIRIVDDYVGLITGLGLQYRKFGFRDSMSLVREQDTIYGTFLPEQRFNTNKFRVASLTVPLLLEFNTSKKHKKSFHLAAGVTGAWNFRQTYKQKYEQDGNDVKDKFRGNFYVNDFNVDASVRVGYGNFTVFANYALTPFFEDGKGPELYPLNVGIQLSSW